MTYNKPELEELGSIFELTNGNGGSTLDGNQTNTQTGGGNDDQEDGGPNSGS